MKRIPTLLLSCLLLLAAHGQRNLEVGMATGVVHYYGDLGNYDGNVQWNSARPGVTLTFRDFLNNKKRYITRALTTEARLSWFRVGYDERAAIKGVEYSDMRNYKRGLSFRNDLIGASGHVVLNAYREPYQPLFQQRFFMYFHVGVGVYYGRPKADLFNGSPDSLNRYHFWDDGTVRNGPTGDPNAQEIERDGQYETDLYEWQTEGGIGAGESGRRYRISPWHIGIPIGAGVRYMVTKQMSVGVEMTYIMFTNDHIDDVSDRYSTYDEIDAAYPGDTRAQQLARYISDPTGYGTNGTTSFLTSRRGNPGLLDTISFVSFEVSYKFKRGAGRRSFLSLKRD
ncbi:MAG: hypothetical protein IPM46_03475 [Flavobacteriales bacterium]|nr:hypothetical protein [Flavobacteriales bacterium]